MDVAGWLRSLGLERYEAAFRENEIDEEVLPRLTAEDLKDLGVAIVGHRRKLLDAIAAMRADLSAKALPPVALLPTDRDTAEHRQVTVMFCDLVGSTALSAQMDPEDLRAIISAYQKCVAETVRHFDGFVAKYMGDGVLVYFGYPQAHEDDAERAVRAALALIEAVPKIPIAPSPPLQVRIGIATGLVVVGDLIGVGAAQEQTIVGETPNLAARLQVLAEPGAVVIASTTRRLIGGMFEYRDLGAVSLKGFAENVPAWKVLGASAAESRFEALRASTTPLVGREEEIELLLRRWEQAKGGDGSVVLVSGEPGIGKSRIVQTLQERLSGELLTRLRYFCSPYHQDSALYPVITQLERAAGFRRDDTVDQRLDKLEAVLAEATNDLADAVPMLAYLLSIPTGERYPPLDLTPQKRKERGNPAGGPVGSRHRQQLNGEFIAALLRDFRQGGPKAIERVRRTQPAAYLKILALLMPREHKVEHRNLLKEMTDEELEAAIEFIKKMLAAQAEKGKVIDGTTAVLPAPAEFEQPRRKRRNRLLEHADTAIDPSRKPQ